MEKLRIYIAAPYTPTGDLHDASRIVMQNVDRVIEAANHIHDIGHYAFVPHLSHYLHIHYSCKINRGVWYYDYDNTFLDLWANAFLCLMSSKGADDELKRFKCRKDIYPLADMPIFYKLEDIPKNGV